MSNEHKNYSELSELSELTEQLGFVIKQPCLNKDDANWIKRCVRDSYDNWGAQIPKDRLMNWGLKNKTIEKEFLNLDLDFNLLKKLNDCLSPMLVYYLVRPILKMKHGAKRLLDIGCANGTALQLCHQLLKTRNALGIDLSEVLIKNARTHALKEGEVNFIQGDAESLPIKDNHIDVITNLESSHLYPQPANFFEEVFRVLVRGGCFCYADILIDEKAQPSQLERILKKNKNLRILKKENITRKVQASIYHRLVRNEKMFCQQAYDYFGQDDERFHAEFPAYSLALGLSFLPKWNARFTHPILKRVAKEALEANYWGSKRFFYYVIQKW